MSLSAEDRAEIRREVLEFKTAQRERNPESVAEELEFANEVLQRLIGRYGSDACRVINEVLADRRQRAGRR